MYHKQAGHMSRPPSPNLPRPTHVPLSLRTSITLTQNAPQQQQGQSASAPSTSTPKPISADKFAKALKLYTKYYMVKGLAQQAQVPQSAIEATNNNLKIPLPARARSLTSRGSSRAYTPSVSNSDYDGVTDISTVVSFGEESQASGTPNGSELLNFNGEVVKQRIRRPLTPVTKAKAALIRHLKSCNVCSTRRVACDLEHHDIASLERARKNKVRSRQRAQSVQLNRSTISGSSQHFSGLASAAQNASGSSMGQTDEFFLGIGQQEELIHTQPSGPIPADAQSPAVPDILSDIPSYHDAPAPAPAHNLVIPFMSINQYSGYQNGDFIRLGVLRDLLYRCNPLDGLCQQAFETAEDLEDHFETHFAYNRQAPADRFRLICSNCGEGNNYFDAPCSGCSYEATIELWVVGSYIRTPTFQRYGPDGQDFLRNDPAPYYPAMEFEMPNSNMDFGLNGGMGNGNYLTDGMNQDFFQNNANFEDPGSQNGDNNGYTTPQLGGYHFQGNLARQRAKASPFTARYWYGKALHTYRHHKVVALTLVLLVALMLLFQTHEWLLTKARPYAHLFHLNLPAFGFVGVLASFVMCYTYWSVKKLGVQPASKTQWPSHRYFLHDMPTMTFHYHQTASNTFVRGGLFS